MRTSTLLVLTASLFACQSQAPTESSVGVDRLGAVSVQMCSEGEHHDRLDQLEGRFDYTCRWWVNGVDETPDVSTGSCTYLWNADDNLLLGQHAGHMMGSPFQGMSVLGFDSASGSYACGWADGRGNMALELCSGDAFRSGSNTFEVHREVQGHPVREVFTFQGEEGHVYEQFRRTQDGDEYRCMRVEYVRAN